MFSVALVAFVLAAKIAVLAAPPLCTPEVVRVVAQDGHGCSGPQTVVPLPFPHTPLRQNSEVKIRLHTKWPVGVSPVSSKFTSGAFDGVDSIFSSSLSVDGIIRFNITTGDMRLLTNFPAGFNNGGLNYGVFGGAAFAGGFIYFAPLAANMFIRLDPKTENMTKVAGIPSQGSGSIAKYAGMAVARGFVYVAPHYSNVFVKLNATSGALEVIRVGLPSGASNPATTRNPFGGIVADQNDDLWLVPLGSRVLVKINTVNDSFVTFPMPSGGSACVGGVSDGRGSVWFAPFDGTHVIRINITTGSTTLFGGWPTGFSRATLDFFHGAVFDGEAIYLVPYSANQLVRVDSRTGNMTAITSWPAGFDYNNKAKFHGGVFIGRHLWLFPRIAPAIVQISPVLSNGDVLNDTAPLDCTIRDDIEQPRTETLAPTRSASAQRSESPSNGPSHTVSPPFTASRQSSQTPALQLHQRSPTVTSTVIVNATETLVPTTSQPSAPPSTLQPPSPQPLLRRVTVTVVLNDALGENGETIVGATSATSIVSAAMLFPTAISRLPRVSATVSLLECGLSGASDGTSEVEQRPAYLELPLQAPVGSGPRRFYAGSALIASCCVFAARMASIIAFLKFPAASFPKLLKGTAVIAAVLETYLAPNAVGAAASAIANGSTVEEFVAAAASIALALASVGSAVAFINITRATLVPPTAATMESASSSSTSSSTNSPSAIATIKRAGGSIAMSWGLLTDGARHPNGDPSIPPTRLCLNYYAVEQLTSCVVAVIAGVEPQSHCETFSLLMIVTLIPYLAYLVAVRPYRTRLDMGFSLLLGVLQLALGVLSWLHLRGDIPLSTVSGFAAAVYFTVLGQVVVQAVWALVVSARRRSRATEGGGEEAKGADAAVPMLQAIGERGEDDSPRLLLVPTINPLQKGQ